MSSFADQLRARRERLRPTDTLIRFADGRQELHHALTNGAAASDIHVQPPAAYGFVVDRSPDAEPACVHSDWLYIGSQDAAARPDLAERFGITHLLSVGIRAPVAAPVAALLRGALYVPCLDVPETPLAAVLDAAVAFIDGCRRDGGRVLVHCNAGVSRSAAVCCGWLMRTEAIGYEEALARVRCKRPQARPNDGFARQLREMSGSK